MKKIVIGSVLLLSGIALYIGVHIPAAHYMSQLSGWSTPPGPYATSLQATGGMAGHRIAIWLGVVGLLFYAWELGAPLVKRSAQAIREADRRFDEQRAEEREQGERQ
ncbi:hypothetical protein [Cohnella nanjingensis]|uniref:Uncharacterized protein n=1 Tax=Cohnella nanjingensis TaxID=1387779 RepID=A0A7X0RTH3_9BACL|nr:hypothetical protein [Cohnella nanjingensis]MBB6673280.1 hypothetical protein [Cohnella nanjingensis]